MQHTQGIIYKDRDGNEQVLRIGGEYLNRNEQRVLQAMIELELESQRTTKYAILQRMIDNGANLSMGSTTTVLRAWKSLMEKGHLVYIGKKAKQKGSMGRGATAAPYKVIYIEPQVVQQPTKPTGEDET